MSWQLICILGVALVGVLQGIVIAVIISIFQFFKRAWRPIRSSIRETEDIAGYHDITHFPNAIQIPGLLMIRWDAPLFFANASLFRKKMQNVDCPNRAQARYGSLSQLSRSTISIPLRVICWWTWTRN